MPSSSQKGLREVLLRSNPDVNRWINGTAV